MKNLAVWLIVGMVLVLLFIFCLLCCSANGSKTGGRTRKLKRHRKIKTGSLSDDGHLESCENQGAENNTEMECDHDYANGEYGTGDGDVAGFDYGGGGGGYEGGGGGGCDSGGGGDD